VATTTVGFSEAAQSGIVDPKTIWLLTALSMGGQWASERRAARKHNRYEKDVAPALS
jgi:hypothetical protein